MLIDCSHGNSGQNDRQQSRVFQDICQQLRHDDSEMIAGVMLESYLRAGKQNMLSQPLQYGVSVTDACIDIDETALLAQQLASCVKLKEVAPLECVNGQ